MSAVGTHPGVKTWAAWPSRFPAPQVVDVVVRGRRDGRSGDCCETSALLVTSSFAAISPEMPQLGEIPKAQPLNGASRKWGLASSAVDPAASLDLPHWGRAGPSVCGFA
jgi:hypothetical protein